MFKNLLSEDIGGDKEQTRIINESEEFGLWEMEIIGSGSPVSLQNGIYCDMHICLCGGSEQRNLKCSQFEVKDVLDPVNTSKMVKCAVYQEHSSKSVTNIFDCTNVSYIIH